MNDNLSEEYDKRINSVINFIENGITNRLPLHDLANVAGFSRFHFHRIFKAFTGETPNEFIWRLRLEKAAQSLKYSQNRSLTDIALENGFESSSSFSRKFKFSYGVTPREFRDNIQPELSPVRKPERYPNPDPLPDVSIVYHENINVLYAANRKGYNDEQIGKAWYQLVKYANKYSLFRKDTRFIGISFDNPEFTDPDKCRYYACITNPGVDIPTGELGSFTVNSGRYASFEFFDTANKIAWHYDYLYRQWFPENNYFPANKPAFDIYKNDPDKDPHGRMKININIPVE